MRKYFKWDSLTLDTEPVTWYIVFQIDDGDQTIEVRGRTGRADVDKDLKLSRVNFSPTTRCWMRKYFRHHNIPYDRSL